MARSPGMGPNERLEQSQWDFFWVPADAEVLERAGVVAVRHPRPIPHLNAVTKTRADAGRLPALVRELEIWLRHPTARWIVPDTFDRGPLEASLAQAGWQPEARFEARAIRPADYARRAGDAFDVRRVDSLELLRASVEVTSGAFARELRYDDAELAEQLAQCADPGGRTHRYVVYRGDEPVSSGGFNFYPALHLAFLWAGGTVPHARGAGAYSALVRARVQAAAALGADWVGLYAKEDTSAPIVARQGFERFGEMRYWTRQPAA